MENTAKIKEITDVEVNGGMNNASKMQLLQEITELEFIGVELNLFLDTHPDNMDALNDYNAYSAQLNAHLKEYNEKFGPLLGFAFQPMATPGSWVNTPWPWQGNKS